MLKGRYFPSSNFLECNQNGKQSWGWRSLLAGREAIKQGIRWNVTGPSFLNIWEEAWIPTLPNFKITSARPRDSLVVYVSDLIKQGTTQWDMNILFASFSPQECLEISKIVIGAVPREAKLVWHFSRSCTPTVKEVYRFLKKTQYENEGRQVPSSFFQLPDFLK